MRHVFSNENKFGDVANHPASLAIWEVLNSHDALIAMKTATYLRRPAIEALIPMLREVAGEILDSEPEKSRRFKMMAGSMVKDVLTRHGYEIDKSNVKLRADEKNMFTVATRYRLKEGV